MSNTGKALVWAAGMIAVAVFMQAQGASDGASFGVIAGMAGAAWGSLNSDAGCGRGCLR
jgi:hypothetical protein